MGHIELLPADPRWPEFFRRVAERLRCALGARPSIEHVGSTAVGIPAKPVLDVLVGVDTPDDVAAATAQLAQAGLVQGDAAVGDASTFLQQDASGGLPPINIHVAVRGSPVWSDLLQFRDLLRSDAELAARYAALKASLIRQAGADLDRYTEGKGPFIRAQLERTS